MMARYQCSTCGYVYDEQQEGSRWSDLTSDWVCPVCGAAKAQFQVVAGDAGQAASVFPARAVTAHRVFGYVFLAVYLVLMFQMVPRLWTYQIEFPARTVVHISLGMAIGALLLLKIAIVRFFRRLDATLVPSLGTLILVASVVLIGISAPSAFREAVATAKLLDEGNRQRVATLLAQTGLDEVECTRLTTPEALRSGQRVLRQECIYCHDLRTVLAKPRTPENWRQTVRRMADRTTMLNPIEENEQLQVTAYLVALSPDLQKSARQLRQQEDRREQAQQAAEEVAAADAGAIAYDPAAAKALFESKCSQCHKTTFVEDAPPGSEDEARELVTQMVDEGLEATEAELLQIVRYLTETHAKASE